MIKERFNKIEVPTSYLNYITVMFEFWYCFRLPKNPDYCAFFTVIRLQNEQMEWIEYDKLSEWSLEMAFLRLEAIFRTCLNAEDYFLRIGKNFSPR
ncbi:hypothetical protein T03_1530 [Trichinella britovi]|uniref:Uncharacterized protein n=1 Tax=Trichinella britovi TaxID=45882 RepID=A0A0V1D5Z2_TRIBR|nr:hypothetical protein T03_1530 [Trichinella britovi]